MDRINDMIYLNKLIALGNYDNTIYYLIVFILIVIIYSLVYPLIKWFVTLQSTRLLSYILCSFIVFLAIFLLVQSFQDMEFMLFETIKMVCKCLAVFGIALIIYHGFHKVKQKT